MNTPAPSFSSASLDTICAIATGNGGALGIVRVSGPQSISIADRIFHGKTPLSAARSHTVHYGYILEKDSSTLNKDENVLDKDGNVLEKSGRIIDEAMVSVFIAPHSYTGENSVEISLHNSPYILERVIQRLRDEGARMAEPGEYTMRAFLNKKMDLTQAEAVADLISSQSRVAHDIALSQMRGGISGRLTELRGQLLRLATLLELELDFSEEDVEFADRQDLLSLSLQTAEEIRHLSSTYTDGNALMQGVPVAIIGAPNVGKSTLLNALLGDDKAIVSSEAGTTRDTVEDTVNIGGILFRIIDTAGLRHTSNMIEQQGIDRAKKAAGKARIILMMSEPGVPYPEISLRPDQTVIRILNKTPQFQAINGTGLAELKKRMVDSLPPVQDHAVLITNQRHKEALERAHDALTRFIDGLGSGLTPDLLAEDLRLAISHLGEITGQITSDDILLSVFANFCIGK